MKITPFFQPSTREVYDCVHAEFFLQEKLLQVIALYAQTAIRDGDNADLLPPHLYTNMIMAGKGF